MEGQLEYWGWEGSATKENEIAAFNEAYPNIKVTYKQLDNDPKYQQQLTPGLLSDSGPDVFMLPPGPSVAQYEPYAEDLTELATASLGEDWQIGDQPDRRRGVQQGRQTRCGTDWVPIAGAWLVNTTILGQLGLDVPTSDMTLDDLEAFCATVVAGGYRCLSLGGQAVSLPTTQFQSISDSIEPGAYVEALAGDREWTDDTLVTALGMMQTMFTKGIFQPGAVTAAPYPDLWTDFLNQKAAMTVLGTWTLNMYTVGGLASNLDSVGLPETSGFTVQLVPSPDLAGTGNQPELPTGPNSGDAINVKSESRAAAQAFVQWKNFSTSGQQYVANALLFVPAMSGVVPEGLELVDPDVQEPSLAQIYELASTSSSPATIQCADLSTAIYTALQEVATGTSVDDAAASLQAASAAIDRAACE